MEKLYDNSKVKTVTINGIYLISHIVNLVLKLLQPKDSYMIHSFNTMEREE